MRRRTAKWLWFLLFAALILQAGRVGIAHHQRVKRLAVGDDRPALAAAARGAGYPGQEPSSTARYFEQLRLRRLFGLAEGAALERLEQEDLPLDRRAELTLELSRTFAEHARFTTGSEQEDLWQRAVGVVEAFLKEHPRSPHRLRLEAQQAFVEASRGEQLRWSAALSSGDDELRSKARQVLAAAVARLRKLDQSIEERIRVAGAAPKGSPGVRGSGARSALPRPLAVHELRTLQENVQYTLAAGLVNLAQVEPAGSAERADALIETEKLLSHLVRSDASRRAGGILPARQAGSLPDGSGEIAWHSSVLLAETARLRGNREYAESILDATLKTSPPRDVRDRLVAVRARVLLDAGRPADAAELLIEYGKLRGSAAGEAGELSFLKVRSLLALWRIAAEKGRSQLAADLLQQVETHVERAIAEVGGYWGYRCRLLLDLARDEQKYGRELAGLLRRVQSLYRDQKMTAAASTLARAAQAAAESGRTEIAAELEYSRGSILLEAGRLAEAGEAFHGLAVKHPETNRTASAHLMWAWCLGRLYEREPTKARRLQYTDALEEHRRKFADKPTFGEATWMLGGLQEYRRQVTAALKLYLEIPPEHARGPAAQTAAARCYEVVLERLQQLNQPADSWRRHALETLGGMAQRFPPPPEPLTRPQAELALRLARIHLGAERPDFAQADRLLDRVFSSVPDAVGRNSETGRVGTAHHQPAGRSPVGDAHPTLAGSDAEDDAASANWDTLLSAANRLRVVSLAGSGQIVKARELVSRLVDAGINQALSVLDGLMKLAEVSTPAARRGLAEVQLQTARQLNGRRKSLSDEQRDRLDRATAEAYAALEMTDDALRVYEELLARSPDDLELLRTVAGQLVKCGTDRCLRNAREHWRRLESRARRGEPDWFDARYHVALCAHRLGRHDECRKLLGVTRLLYPSLGGEESKARFDALEAKLPQTRTR